MKRILRFLIRGLILVALLLAIDQAMLRIEPDIPGIRKVRSFYVDFRARLVNLIDRKSASSIEAEIETADAPAQEKQPGAHQSADSPRYVFADENGQLQFADSLDQIPPAYRQSAELLEE